MATVPGSDRAIVDPAKVAGYLLSTAHPIGRAKALFFIRFGFREDAPEELEQALLDHVHDNAVADIQVSSYGTKYRVDGHIASPDGRSPRVSSVWMIRRGASIPHFVTAFPC